MAPSRSSTPCWTPTSPYTTPHSTPPSALPRSTCTSDSGGTARRSSGCSSLLFLDLQYSSTTTLKMHCPIKIPLLLHPPLLHHPRLISGVILTQRPCSRSRCGSARPRTPPAFLK